MRIRTTLVALVAASLSTAVTAQATPTGLHPGQYKLSVGKYAEGSIIIRSVQSDSATFELNYWQCVSQCQNKDSNFWSVNNGIVESGTIKLSGSTGKYVSDNEEDEDLGHCFLHFQFNKQVISVRQPERCWWFGDRVNVSGQYRLQSSEKKK